MLGRRRSWRSYLEQRHLQKKKQVLSFKKMSYNESLGRAHRAAEQNQREKVYYAFILKLRNIGTKRTREKRSSEKRS